MSSRLTEFPLALGCMSLSHAYGNPTPREQGISLIRDAFELGVRHFDTAVLYGFGRNEELVGEAIKPFRDQVHLASKCGLTSPDMKRVIDGRPESIKRTCDESLKRLQTDVIDLYYLHRLDKNVPIEDSVGALKELVEAGKVHDIGLSEVSADTIRRAHRVHPIAAVQTEYSLWSRNAEIAVLDVCGELGITFVAFSPLARGFLTGTLSDPHNFPDGDIRLNMPRFQSPHYEKNRALLTPFAELADSAGCSMAQLALAWLLHQDCNILPIPGTTNAAHLRENLGALDVRLDGGQIETLNQLFSVDAISGPRYGEKTQREIDTEQFLI